MVREGQRNAYFALAPYSLLALIAFWFPLSVAAVTTALFTYWLVYSLRAT
jgi:hypothetical protein